MHDLGHIPLLSEFPTFPILPDLKTVENCKRNVAANTDVFILIVGGKGGSLDPDTCRPVTNVEYETALQHGIDTFIFVSRVVWDLLPVWEKNPSADFSPHVDSPQVFSFIKSLKADQKWIFTFDRVAEITETIKVQLSVFLSDLIKRKKEGKLKPLVEFLGESPRAQQIALERPLFWEYLLTEELLRARLARVRRAYDDLQRDLLYHPTRTLRGREFTDWARDRIKDIERLFHIIEITTAEEIPKSWGPKGQAGDPAEIKLAVDRLAKACDGLLDWEVEFASVNPPSAFSTIREKMCGWTVNVISEMQRLPEEIAKPLRSPNPQGQFVIDLAIRAFPNAQETRAEFKQLLDHPEAWINDY